MLIFVAVKVKKTNWKAFISLWMSAKSNILCQILFYQSPSISAKKRADKKLSDDSAAAAAKQKEKAEALAKKQQLTQ